MDKQIMERKIAFTAGDSLAGERLDIIVIGKVKAEGLELTRSGLKTQQLQIYVNGKPEKAGYKTRPGDNIEITIPEKAPIGLPAQDIPFDIVYLDDDIAVINKPYGLAVHPSKGHEDMTLVNGLLFRLGGKLSSVGGNERPGIVHRLDKDTAGLMTVALNDRAHHRLSDDFRTRKVRKTYYALVKGRTDPSGKIDLPIGRSINDRKKMSVRTDGKPAVTEYRTIEYFKEHSLLEINLMTGRTHQIRVHFSHIGHPVAGDPLYSRNPRNYRLKGIALCAKKLEFRHPVTGRDLSFEIELPDDFLGLLESLRKSGI